MSLADARTADKDLARWRDDFGRPPKLPPAEAPQALVQRMAAFVQHRVAAAGAVTRDDLLLAGGFSAAEIDDHFPLARRLARVERMAG